MLVVTTALHTLQNLDSLILASNSSLMPPISNTSKSTDNPAIITLPHLTSTLTATPIVKCEPDIYGHPPAASCQEAMSLIPIDAATILRNPKLSIGPRTLGHWDVPLPKRFISCKDH